MQAVDNNDDATHSMSTKTSCRFFRLRQRLNNTRSETFSCTNLSRFCIVRCSPLRPSNIERRRLAYSALPHVRVEPLHLSERDLTADRMLAIMGCENLDNQPLYLHTVFRIPLAPSLIPLARLVFSVDHALAGLTTCEYFLSGSWLARYLMSLLHTPCHCRFTPRREKLESSRNHRGHVGIKAQTRGL
ncbi:hypothetical protein FB45DRAFT_425010 [Roridomyces roridus]|uniref:Uncharacterized protein n=1 Tax=Roridomyces roridus TaxID=1738132 RepID=A0AAD7C5P5_9AGAR|nr:hypothetical protein FB45DRAFT_425010 [Roridomyces roridus]